MAIIEIMINGVRLPVEGSVTYNFQSGSVADVSLSKSNYTSTFKIPRVYEAQRFFYGLGIEGNISSIPYQENEAIIYEDGIEVYKGSLIVLKTDYEYYYVSVIDGARDFFLELGDTTFANLNIDEIIHPKTVNVVRDHLQFTNTDPFIYSFAYFGGNPNIEKNGRLYFNVDFMAPAVLLSYLIQKIEDYSGFDLIFPDDIQDEIDRKAPDNVGNIKALLFPYPSYLEVGSDENVALRAEAIDWIDPNDSPSHLDAFSFTDFTLFQNKFTPSGNSFLVNTADEYILSISDFIFDFYSVGVPNARRDARIQIYINGSLYDTLEVADGTGGTEIYRTVLELDQGDVVRFEIYRLGSVAGLASKSRIKNLKVEMLDADISEDAVGDIYGFGLSDFIKELCYEYALIPRYEGGNVVRFVKLEDLLDTDNSIDWSDKFNSKLQESYDNGYAINNYLRHKYADDALYNYDRNFINENKNLLKDKTIVDSKLYAPNGQVLLKLGEYDPINPSDPYVLRYFPIYDVTDGLKAKTNKRFFFVDITYYYNKYAIASGTLPGTSVNEQVVARSEFKSQFSQNNRWDDLARIMINPKVVNVTFHLFGIDIINFDATKPIYVRQLNGYFNIVSLRYKNGDLAEAELIKIN